MNMLLAAIVGQTAGDTRPEQVLAQEPRRRDADVGPVVRGVEGRAVGVHDVAQRVVRTLQQPVSLDVREQCQQTELVEVAEAEVPQVQLDVLDEGRLDQHVPPPSTTIV
jgi:hypothetical protein